MAINVNTNAFVVPRATQIALSQMFTTTASSGNPNYLVLTALDRNEYTAGANGSTGSFIGNGHTLKLSSIGGDGRGAGIVFTYQPSTGRYYNSTYNYLDQMLYVSSNSLNDVTNLSLFASNSVIQDRNYADNAYTMMQIDPLGYIGSSTIVTQAPFTGTVPSQATPQSIAAAAESFVGKAWNRDGCWVLASAIAAEGGASLPVQSTAAGLPGRANGEWIVAYNGPAGASGNWRSMLKAGEVILFATSGGRAHIATAVSGSGGSAMLVDNVTYTDSFGRILNSANDGSDRDIIVSAPHPAYQEWSGVQESSVVIYELDTPTVVANIAREAPAAVWAQSLGSLFSATDPAGKQITKWQVYNTSSADTLVLGGVKYEAHTAASALTTASLASVSLLAGSAAGSDALVVRAYNGSYWGDWTSLSVSDTQAIPQENDNLRATPPAFVTVTNVSTGQTTTDGGQPYSGPVAGLANEYINITTDNLNITANAPNSFIHSGAGNDAIDVSKVNGTNVIDGSAGSNFLVGGTGNDTFFVDDRVARSDIWSTVVNFHSGDAATIWGVTQSDFSLSWMDGQGAPDYTGLTLHATAAGVPTASLTLAGFTSADLTNGTLTASYGTTTASGGVPGSTYMYVHAT